jgi:hypothetical protein
MMKLRPVGAIKLIEARRPALPHSHFASNVGVGEPARVSHCAL